MVLPFNIEAAVDMGFIALVVFTCYRALFQESAPNAADSAPPQWKEELTSLEGMLRELIGEASAASNNLNRSLLKRKEELQQILTQIDEAESRGVEVFEQTKALIAQRETIRRKQEQALQTDTLPNNTWAPAPKMPVSEPRQEAPAIAVRHSLTSAYEELLKAAQDRPPMSQSRYENVEASAVLSRVERQEQQGTSSSAPTQFQKDLREPKEARNIVELDELAEQSEDRVTLSQPIRPSLREKLSSSSTVLAAKIEKIKQEKQPKVNPFLTPSVDPTTYKIAKRLLASGKEIHVVARKLDLPLSEIREIERTLRLENGEDGVAAGDGNGMSDLEQNLSNFERSSALV